MRLLVLSIVSCGMVIFSCSSISRIKSESKCDRLLMEYISNNWKYDTINNIVLLESRESLNFFLGTIPESECIRGKSKNEIKHLFGIPQNITNNKFMYYMGAICNTPSARDCTYIHFDFDENGIYKEMGISGWSKSH